MQSLTSASRHVLPLRECYKLARECCNSPELSSGKPLADGGECYEGARKCYNTTDPPQAEQITVREGYDMARA